MTARWSDPDRLPASRPTGYVRAVAAPVSEEPGSTGIMQRKLLLEMREEVEMARPTGVGHALATGEILIEGRDEWLASPQRLA